MCKCADVQMCGLMCKCVNRQVSKLFDLKKPKLNFCIICTFSNLHIRTLNRFLYLVVISVV